MTMSIKQMFIHWRNITSYKRYDKWCQDEDENSELEEILLGLNINMYV